MRILICYYSFSGNTKEVAEIIKSKLEENHIVDIYRIGSGLIPDLSLYDKIFLGTFTWGKGAVPNKVKDFVAEVGYKPSNIYIFGTGDTQFGGDKLFCNAATKLAKFYNCKYPPLKIEQSPRGNQEETIKKWIKGLNLNA